MSQSIAIEQTSYCTELSFFRGQKAVIFLVEWAPWSREDQKDRCLIRKSHRHFFPCSAPFCCEKTASKSSRVKAYRIDAQPTESSLNHLQHPVAIFGHYVSHRRKNDGSDSTDGCNCAAEKLPSSFVSPTQLGLMGKGRSLSRPKVPGGFQRQHLLWLIKPAAK